MIREIEFLDHHLRSLGFEEEHLLDDHSILSTYCLNEEGLSIRVAVKYVAKESLFEFETHEIEIHGSYGVEQHQISQLRELKELVDYLRNLMVVGVCVMQSSPKGLSENFASLN